MAKSDTGVAIIGGGAAGIAAGRRLAKAAIDCLVIEARPRLGGRAWTVHDAAGHALDLGCGWLHSADHNPWSSIAKAQGRTIDRSLPPWQKPALTVGFPAEEQAALSKARNEFLQRLETIGRKSPDVPASDAFDPNSRWNGMIDAFGTYFSGAEFEYVSALDFDNYKDTEINWRVGEGYGTAIAAHGEPLAAILDCPVLQIDHGGRRLKIETAKGTITADQAIVTLPSAIIAEKEFLFSPALPDKTEAAAGLPLGLADKLFLSLSDAEEFEPDSRLYGRTDRTATATYQLRSLGRPLIEVYFGGRFAKDLEAGGDEAFADYAIAELVHLLGEDFRKRVKPLRIHRWAADPFALGSYSYAKPGKADCRLTLAAPVDGRLFFAGEACSEHDFSTAHGGYLTGVAAADQAIAARKRQR
jgi:monoamine oxidase